jgi:hypothetical protein
MPMTKQCAGLWIGKVVGWADGKANHVSGGVSRLSLRAAHARFKQQLEWMTNRASAETRVKMQYV